MMKWALYSLLCIFGFLGFYLYFYLGFYKDVHIEVRENVEFKLLGHKHDGEYHKILPVIEKVRQWAISNNIRCPQTFGHYLDDPRSGPADRLRSIGGCVVEYEVQQIQEPYQFSHRKPQSYIYASFEGAPSIGPLKVYPKVTEFAQKQRIPASETVIEVYTLLPKNKIRTEYYFPIQ